jgi:hypothetical protein
VRHVSVRLALAAGAVIVLATLLGCSDARKPEITKITFDGETYEIDGYVSCVRQLDGGLLINAPVPSPSGGLTPGGGKKLIRVELLEEPRIIVESAALRFDDVRGFTHATDEMWGAKVDDVYTINGRMPDADGPEWHQFEIEVICSYVDTRFVTRHG